MGEGTHTIGRILETAEVTTFRSPTEIVHALSDNLSDRTAFAIRYLSWLARGGNSPSPMLGADILQGAKMTVPDAIYHIFGASKDPVRRAGEEEDVANEHFGLPDEDMANLDSHRRDNRFWGAGRIGLPSARVLFGASCDHARVDGAETRGADRSDPFGDGGVHFVGNAGGRISTGDEGHSNRRRDLANCLFATKPHHFAPPDSCTETGTRERLRIEGWKTESRRGGHSTASRLR